MRTIEEIKEILKERKEELRVKYKVKELGIFGSYVRGEQNKKSDLDILVAFYETPSLLRFINLENYLSDLLGRKVDLVMKRALKPNIGKAILEEVIPI
ncbi:nucleotidyltransferase family protein [Candidatus Aerophobetes bacterium]|nr:nucleotidyltransferase family protein [Candidatus Aerophobetes bacterium]